MSNTITYKGETVNIGPTPSILHALGFSGPDEVRRIAIRCSAGEPYMDMSGAVERFRKRYPQKG